LNVDTDDADNPTRATMHAKLQKTLEPDLPSRRARAARGRACLPLTLCGSGHALL